MLFRSGLRGGSGRAGCAFNGEIDFSRKRVDRQESEDNTDVYPAAPGARHFVKVESYEDALSRRGSQSRTKRPPTISQKCRRGDVEERGKRADVGLARLAFPVDDVGRTLRAPKIGSRSACFKSRCSMRYRIIRWGGVTGNSMRSSYILTRCSSKSRSADSSRLSVSPCTSRRSSASMRATARSNSARVSITFGSAAESSLPYLVGLNSAMALLFPVPVNSSNQLDAQIAADSVRRPG